MADRIPASELYKIQKEDLLDAIANFRERALPPTFKDSTRFDLLIDGKRFPPKAIVALAARRPLGRILSSSEFSGGESSAAFRLLLERGFEFATKMMKVAEFDSTVSVGCNKETYFVLVESGGPGRNTDYGDGLEALLRGLADLDASIEGIFIDSTETRKLPLNQRSLKLRTRGYPLRLRAAIDLGLLRREITGVAAKTGRSLEATGAGNPEKRLRIVFTEPEDLELFRIAVSLTQNRGIPSTRSREFLFRARPPAPNGGQTNARRAIGEAEVTHIHDQMQLSLYDSLVAVHGPDKVSCEEVTSSGCPADVIVSLSGSYELFEIKTKLAPRDCVREALGQLLEYAYWPGSPGFSALWIVGPSPIDGETQQHLDGLRVRFGIPVGYRHQPVSALQAEEDTQNVVSMAHEI
jgi:hypothetical protein